MNLVEEKQRGLIPPGQFGLVHDVQKAGVKDVYVAERMTRADLPSNEEKNSLIFDTKDPLF